MRWAASATVPCLSTSETVRFDIPAAVANCSCVIPCAMRTRRSSCPSPSAVRSRFTSQTSPMYIGKSSGMSVSGQDRNYDPAAMSSKRSPKGRGHRVPDSWLQQCNQYKERTRKTLSELGRELAEAIGRNRPLATSTVHDYLIGRIVTEELTEAWAKLMETLPPVIGGDDDEVQEWCDLGRQFKAESPETFRRELEALRKVVSALVEYRGRR